MGADLVVLVLHGPVELKMTEQVREVIKQVHKEGIPQVELAEMVEEREVDKDLNPLEALEDVVRDFTIAWNDVCWRNTAMIEAPPNDRGVEAMLICGDTTWGDPPSYPWPLFYAVMQNPDILQALNVYTDFSYVEKKEEDAG